MRKYGLLLVITGLSFVGLTTAAVWVVGKEKEEKISLDKLPPAVKATILKAAKGGTITEIEMEEEKGKLVYEAEIKLDGKEMEITVSADGKLLSEETEDEDDDGDDDNDDDDDDGDKSIPIGEVPPIVLKALKKRAGTAEILKVESEEEHGTKVYEAEWKVDGRSHEVTVTADGVLVEREVTVESKALPEAVRKAVAKLFPKAESVEIKRKVVVSYEIQGEVDGKDVEVLISPAGKVLEREDGDDEEDQDDDDDDDDEDDGDDEDDN